MSGDLERWRGSAEEKLRSLEARIVKNEASHDAMTKRVWAILFVIIAALINLLAGKITFTGGD
jgi:hypothetical protein